MTLNFHPNSRPERPFPAWNALPHESGRVGSSTVVIAPLFLSLALSLPCLLSDPIIHPYKRFSPFLLALFFRLSVMAHPDDALAAVSPSLSAANKQ